MRKFIIISLVLLLIVPLTVFGQYRESNFSPGLRNSFIQPSAPGGFLNGLYDPSRMQMNQSYSMAYSTSGGEGFMQGLYLNNMRYQLSNPLMLDLNLGYMFTPYSSYDNGINGMNSGKKLIDTSPNPNPARLMTIADAKVTAPRIAMCDTSI